MGDLLLYRIDDAQVGAHVQLGAIRLRDGAIVDDLDLADGYPVQDTLRRIGQLG